VTLTRTLKGVLLLAVIDIVIIWLWAANEDLQGAAMYVYILVPFVFLINLIISGILFFVKRAYSAMFFINSVSASFIAYWLFTAEMSKQADAAFDSWRFNIQDTIFRIDKSNKTNDFSISYSFESGSSFSFMEGQYKLKNDTLLLKSDSVTMFIYKGKLHNFRQSERPSTLEDY